ncbi:hypothetical protein X753_04575 [Mesorhizobium sp. LNJC399B00]|uniref:hypothetical protein n=1 Tax=unclassified Mesorhizobium TaxID=325217 RepID=UPI0003CF06F1|nr:MULTISPECIES: hypothetical protein [unclassified Mesorhizobium]ESY08054.1 hypothetical protein X753_04575 [Mesorhizobium sp. LNJC399B00]WJI71382.1 hypothetical protein NLY36_11575 [Mesorhizobium sp. C399B]
MTHLNSRASKLDVSIPRASDITGSSKSINSDNPAYLKDDAVAVAKPEAVMYEPMAYGSLKARSNILPRRAASLEGQLFKFKSAPNRYGLGRLYELHAWAWKRNPTGTFANMNPNVSCEATKGDAGIVDV